MSSSLSPLGGFTAAPLCHREVERILAERRRTGVFTLVTDTPERHSFGADIKRKRMSGNV